MVGVFLTVFRIKFSVKYNRFNSPPRLVSLFSDLISLWEVTCLGLNWVNIMQGMNEVMEFLSGKVFFISLFLIGVAFPTTFMARIIW